MEGMERGMEDMGSLNEVLYALHLLHVLHGRVFVNWIAASG